MNEKQLLDNLKALKTINLDGDWKRRNRDVLFSQVSNSAVEDEKSIAFFVFFSRLASHPVAVAFFAFILIGSGFAYSVSRQFKPGDSLYVARLASEKAQLAVTFDKGKKEKMELRFASERARDIVNVLENPATDQNKKQELENNFQQEIAVVKAGVKKMGVKKNIITTASVVEPATVKDDKKADQKTEDKPEADTAVFSAGSGRATRGVKVSTSSSEEVANTSTKEVTAEVSGHAMVEEVEKLFQDKNYGATRDKLQEVEAMIEGKGLVKGEESGKIDSSVQATSSQHN